jgi:hypothetical protein
MSIEKKKTTIFRYILITTFMVFSLIISSLSAYAASPLDDETKAYIQKLEKRVSDLESLVNKLLHEKKPAPAAIPSKPAVAEAKDKKEAADEWGEPVVETDIQKARDEEARRRLTELETWKRKLDARTAKEEEEAREKPKFAFSGKYKLRLNIKDNINLNNPRQEWTYDNATYFDQRFQLKIEADYGPITGVVLFDKGNFVFDWKEDSEGTLDRWSEFLTVNSALVRELYVQYTGDFIVKAGRQNVMAGNDGVVLEGPVDAFKISYPIGQTPLGRVTGNLTYIAVAGGFRNYNNFGAGPAGDRSAALGIANKLDGFLISLNIKPRRDLNIEPYVLKVFDRGKFGDPDLNLDKDFNLNTTPRDGSFEPLWLGIALSGKGEKISYMADLIYLTGQYTNARDLSAYAFLLRGDYHFGNVGFLKKFSAGLEFGRGSGNKADDPAGSDYKNFRGLFLCKDRRKFGNIFSEDLRAGYYLWDSNLANVTFIRAIAGFEPVKSLQTNISLARYWTTESVYKGRGPVPGIDWSSGASLATGKTRDIGWGIDLDLNFPIYKRLRGFTEAGYFVPSAVYQQANGQKADPASKVVLGAEFEF